jgi:alkylhydroperoxidase family enzyme
MPQSSPQPHLPPLARSWNPLVWAVALIYRVLIGRVVAPVRVVYARAPRIVVGHLMLMATAEYGLSLDRRVSSLVRVFGSRVNNCMFCDDLETHMALKRGAICRADVDALRQFATAPEFSERERAALRYVEEINTTRTSSDQTFDALRKHFTEREIVEITWLNAVGNYLNLQAKPLGLGSEGFCAVPERSGQPTNPPAAGARTEMDEVS